VSVFKLYKGKKITSKHPAYPKAKWWCYKRIAGHKTLHRSIPEARTKEQAEIAERKLIDEVFAGRFGGPRQAPTFADFVDNVYLKYVQQKNVNVYVKKIFCEELKKFFGKMRMSDITPQDCRDYQDKRSKTPTKYGTPRANGSVNKETSTLSRIFTIAMEQEILTASPMRFVTKLEEAEPRHRVLTAKQKAALWVELEKDTYVFRFIVLATNLPLRKSQILAINEAAIDFEHERLLTISSKGRKPRYVPLNRTAMAILRTMADEGQFFEVGRFEKRWMQILRNAGINKKKEDGGSRDTNYHLHDLRVWFGSELLKQGVNPYHIKELFGHSSMDVSSIYIVPDDIDLADAVRRLDDVQNSEIIQ